MCPFDNMAVAGSGKVWPVNQINHTSWVAEVTLTDRPKSQPLCNRAFWRCLCCHFALFAGVGDFVIGLSHFSFLFLLEKKKLTIFGKCEIINTLAVSKLIYVASVLSLPNDTFIKGVNRLIHMFYGIVEIELR